MKLFHQISTTTYSKLAISNLSIIKYHDKIRIYFLININLPIKPKVPMKTIRQLIIKIILETRKAIQFILKVTIILEILTILSLNLMNLYREARV